MIWTEPATKWRNDVAIGRQPMEPESTPRN